MLTWYIETFQMDLRHRRLALSIWKRETLDRCQIINWNGAVDSHRCIEMINVNWTSIKMDFTCISNLERKTTEIAGSILKRPTWRRSYVCTQSARAHTRRSCERTYYYFIVVAYSAEEHSYFHFYHLAATMLSDTTDMTTKRVMHNKINNFQAFLGKVVEQPLFGMRTDVRLLYNVESCSIRHAQNPKHTCQTHGVMCAVVVVLMFCSMSLYEHINVLATVYMDLLSWAQAKCFVVQWN